MHAQARIKLFGPLVVEVDGRRADLGSSPTQQFLARLSASPNTWLERTAIAEDLWPDVEFAVSSNRLRTHLVYLKKGLDPWTPIAAERSRIRLESAGATIDIESAEHFIKQLRIQRDHKEEKEVLGGLLAIIDRDFLDGWNADWILPMRAYWRDHRADAYLRLARFANDDDDLEAALTHIDRAILADEFRPEAWAQFLRIMGRLGRGAHALARFRAIRQQMKSQLDMDFGEDVLELSRAVGRGAIGPSAGVSSSRRHFTMEERELILSTVERSAAASPASLLELYGSDAFRRELYKNPHVAFKMVNAAFDSGEGIDPHRVRAVWTIMMAGTLLDETERKLELCKWVLENLEESTQDYWAALSQTAFTKFEIRDWDAAYDYIERARKNAEAYNRPYGLIVCKAQLGSFHWHLNRLDEAMVLYHEALVEYGQGPDVRQAHNLAALRINCGFLESIRGNWEACRDWTEQGWRLAVVGGLEGVLHWAFPLMGLAKIMGGEVRPGCRMIIDGVTLCYARRNIRMHEIGMDYATCALVELGHIPQALALAEAYTTFRGNRRHARSPAEQSLVDMFLVKAGKTKPDPSWVGLSISDYIIRVCALLEKAE